MKAEQQYIDLFTHYEDLICRHAAGLMNLPRAEALADLERLGFPTVKSEDYKYTDVAQAFAPDYGVNINRLDIPVNPYDVFRCDVPNLSTSLYFVVNDTSMTRCYRKPSSRRCLCRGNAYFHGKVSRSGFPLLWQGGTNR